MYKLEKEVRKTLPEGKEYEIEIKAICSCLFLVEIRIDNFNEWVKHPRIGRPPMTEHYDTQLKYYPSKEHKCLYVKAKNLDDLEVYVNHLMMFDYICKGSPVKLENNLVQRMEKDNYDRCDTISIDS